jgi:hypothetical protein
MFITIDRICGCCRFACILSLCRRIYKKKCVTQIGSCFQCQVSTHHNFRNLLTNSNRFDRYFHVKYQMVQLDEETPSYFLNYRTIHIGTCYFMSCRNDPEAPVILFDCTVDPKHILSSMTDNIYFHGPDEKVLYYTLVSTKGDNDPL